MKLYKIQLITEISHKNEKQFFLFSIQTIHNTIPLIPKRWVTFTDSFGIINSYWLF